MGSITARGNGAGWLYWPSAVSLANAARVIRDLAAAVTAPVIAATGWRRRRLLILGYHGVSLDDEHLWDGTVYMPPKVFERRLHIIREAGCTVLPLQVALERLYEGTLPPRAVALVFDDGFHDFARVAAPLLARFNYKATVFLSTYYAKFNRPIFDVMLRYLLWKGAGTTLVLPGFLDAPVRLDETGQRYAAETIMETAFERGMSGREKDALLARTAEELQIDYGRLCESRLFHMMNAGEVRAMKAQGHDIQMHTHRHKVSRRRELFEREIGDNREWIERETDGPRPLHFSFPGGVWQPVAREWLTELGIKTAITCRPGLAEVRSDRLHLPRFMDHAHVGEWAFRGWLAGSMAFLPMGKEIGTDRQILEETIKEKARAHSAR
jgi:peptidoglycan/xylan/chitin deacetylase (PgdA/CDA1 family)